MLLWRCGCGRVLQGMTLETFCVDGERKGTSMLGSMLFSRFVSGTRVVTTTGSKSVAGLSFPGYGAHADAYTVPYITAAAAMGMKKGEVDVFVQRLQAVIDEFRKQHPEAGLSVSAGDGAAEPEPEPEPAAAEVEAAEAREGRAGALGAA